MKYDITKTPEIPKSKYVQDLNGRLCFSVSSQTIDYISVVFKCSKDDYSKSRWEEDLKPWKFVISSVFSKIWRDKACQIVPSCYNNDTKAVARKLTDYHLAVKNSNDWLEWGEQ